MQEKDRAHLLLQRRHVHKKDYPGMLDITSAGHLEAGETPQDGVRELREELGIEPEPGKLVYAGVIGDSTCSRASSTMSSAMSFSIVMMGQSPISACRKMRSIPSSGSKRKLSASFASAKRTAFPERSSCQEMANAVQG
ncbi:NUDIX domain-containing protein [Paenibacillus dendritiformis]|uniref:NUDIX domain-containing protein n=1 Tax=Paenibacillus dendritiformis TaxID=130049 RepID=UPI001F552AB6|nr:NUDIX domain-containing protein [Paenibacillus dendritiformis]